MLPLAELYKSLVMTNVLPVRPDWVIYPLTFVDVNSVLKSINLHSDDTGLVSPVTFWQSIWKVSAK